MGDVRDAMGLALPDAGLVPDVPVTPTAEDIARGRDRALEVALRVAAGRTPP